MVTISPGMDLIRFGRGIRALRIRRSWRQQDLADAAGVSRSLVARAEIGGGGTIPAEKLDRVARALGARTDLRLLWNGEALDRLLDSAHAGLVERVATHLRAAGWDVAIEATFSIYGERGSIDVLGWHASTRVILVVEVKSVVPDIQAMLGSLDRKVRLAPRVAEARGWAPGSVGKLLVIGEDRTARRRLQEHGLTVASGLPDRAIAVRHWIAHPRADQPIRGVWFLSGAHRANTRHRVAKVRQPGPVQATTNRRGDRDR